ncbi:SDR family NAD(P)-dependent oxidoreductase [Moorena sp. SIO3I8]|uniref:SDR family NAD(P)-dependent oxidoreductase n=1 Tax=Moorena sp. SIO3I8 TaxID=2607833 RepID=UPI0025E39F77|nr:SDR family NAD(P)-dependent oxidoreductase [Moorena sp. SIO3I8]
MTQEFAGQKIIVVGGTSGMGKAVAQLILQQGGAAVLIGSRQPKLEEAVTELSQYGTVVGELANISDPQMRNALINRLILSCGQRYNFLFRQSPNLPISPSPHLPISP